jgi:hypothetical protein
VGVGLFHAERGTDREADMTVIIVAVRNFAEVPEKGHLKESLVFEKRDLI